MNITGHVGFLASWAKCITQGSINVARMESRVGGQWDCMKNQRPFEMKRESRSKYIIFGEIAQVGLLPNVVRIELVATTSTRFIDKIKVGILVSLTEG